MISEQSDENETRIQVRGEAESLGQALERLVTAHT